ncbi:Acetyltransferase [Ensifer sp. M14]|uniref:GNAT family N-acetyltransferase n=1 Tax=Ensifer sp. M14 TaxID=2203782 RepID=UPI000E1C42F9|nr:GNAT family N-acetyltransferase [Ensifer sp. M14]RDL51439.1 Acetyltransferase [Ensifer sp. M14]
MRIDVHDTEIVPGAEDVTAGLLAHMIEMVGTWPRVPLTLLLRDEGGRVCGGIRAMVALCWLQIDHVWVDAALRGQGHGSRLLQRAEEEARAHGAIGVQLTTSTFQAIGFYERHGYAEIGRLRDRPPGEDRVWMAKRWG